MRPTDRRREAYIWTREHARSRLALIDQVRWQWEQLFGEPGDRGHVMRWHCADLPQAQDRCGTFDGILDGEEQHIHLTVLPLKGWFAREVYRRALARTRARYPDFEAHHFEDGPRVGERVLVCDSPAHNFAWSHLYISLWKVIEEERPTVRETMVVEPCDRSGTVEAVARTRSWSEGIDRGHRRVTVVYNVPSVSEGLFEQVKAELGSGRLPPLNPAPVAFGFQAIEAGFVELSDPELVWLNWGAARKSPGPTEKALFDACERLDLGAIRAALAAGADPNAFDRYGETALTTLLQSLSNNDYLLEHPAERQDRWPQRTVRPVADVERVELAEALLEAGYHPDLHLPEESTALNQAVMGGQAAVVERLLARGADASIHVYWDDGYSQWPEAWDTAATESQLEGGPYDRIWEMFCRQRPTPGYDREITYEAPDRDGTGAT